MDHTVYFWVGDVIGIATTAPFLLIHGCAHRARRPLRITLEGVLQTLSIALVLALISELEPGRAANLFYVLFMPLVWISTRYGFEGATAGLLATQLGLIAAVQLAGYTTEWVLQFQLLMLALTVTAGIPRHVRDAVAPRAAGARKQGSRAQDDFRDRSGRDRKSGRPLSRNRRQQRRGIDVRSARRATERNEPAAADRRSARRSFEPCGPFRRGPGGRTPASCRSKSRSAGPRSTLAPSTLASCATLPTESRWKRSCATAISISIARCVSPLPPRWRRLSRTSSTSRSRPRRPTCSRSRCCSRATPPRIQT